MALDFECSACQAALRAPETLLAKTVRCPQCEALLYLPTTERPLPELCDMALGYEPRLVSPRPAEPDPLPSPMNVEDPTGGAT